MRWLWPLGLLGCSGAADSAAPSPRESLSDSASPGDTAAPLLLRERLLVAEGNSGQIRWFDSATGDLVGEICLASLFPDTCGDESCALWSVEQGVVDGRDQLLVSYERPLQAGGVPVGGLLGLAPGKPTSVLFDVQRLDWTTHLAGIYDGVCDAGDNPSPCRLRDPHAVARTASGWLAVADSSSDRLLLLSVSKDAVTGDDVGVVRVALDATTLPVEDWEGCKGVNNVEVFSRDGRELMLTTCKGMAKGLDQKVDHGHLFLWDITDPEDIQRLWRFPEAEAYLWAVHHGNVVDGPTGPLLVWGHSLGASSGPRGEQENGSVGVADFSMEVAPVYLGDGLMPETQPALGFLRAVTVLPGGEGLLLTDSGCEKHSDPDCANPPRLLEVSWPELTAPGLGGGHSDEHEDQSFFELSVGRSLDSVDLMRAYEAHGIGGDDLGRPLGTDTALACD